LGGYKKLAGAGFVYYIHGAADVFCKFPIENAGVKFRGEGTKGNGSGVEDYFQRFARLFIRNQRENPAGEGAGFPVAVIIAE